MPSVLPPLSRMSLNTPVIWVDDLYSGDSDDLEADVDPHAGICLLVEYYLIVSYILYLLCSAS